MIRLYLIVLAAFLVMDITAPTAAARNNLSQAQARRRAHYITQRLRKENPQVLKWVMQQMGWVPKIKYSRERRRKQQSRQAFDDWYIDMMRDMGGLR